MPDLKTLKAALADAEANFHAHASRLLNTRAELRAAKAAGDADEVAELTALVAAGQKRLERLQAAVEKCDDEYAAAAAAVKTEAAAPAAVAVETTEVPAASIVAALTDGHTCATPRNVAAVAELATAFNSAINEPHRHLLNAVGATLETGNNCVGTEQYALAALYSKHRAAGWLHLDALTIASDELEALSRRALEDVALAA